MRAYRAAVPIALAALLSLLVVNTANADDEPALTTPGAPVVVANEPHTLTLSWAPAIWVGEPGGPEPITYEVRVPLGPHVYRSLASTNATTPRNRLITTINSRRPPREWSSSRPRNGATSANGASVSNR